MKLQLLEMPQKVQKQTVHWLAGLAKNKELFTSKLPKKIDVFPEYPISAIESVVFNKPISTEEFSNLFIKAPINASERMVLIDFGKHLWTKCDMTLLKDWVSASCKTISYIQLSDAQFTIEAWKVFCNWLENHPIQLESIDLGRMRMSLPRVRSLHNVCKSRSLKLEKLDFGESVWTVAHLKAFLWNLFANKISLSRLSLSAAQISNDGLDLLLFYLSSPYCDIKVFSSGIMKMSSKALGYILDKAMQESGSLEACILSEQTFNTRNADKLANLLNRYTSLKHLALLNCEWAESYGNPEFQDSKKSIQRIFVESMSYKKDNSELIHALLSWGYEISRRTGKDGYCLKPNKEKS